MESAYIKETVGPILAKALSDIVIHCPESQHSSSYSSLSDPVTILGEYLLEYDRLTKQGKELHEKQEKLAQLVNNYNTRQNRVRDSKLKLQEQLTARVSVRRSVIEAQMEPVRESTIEAPAAEEPAPQEVVANP